MNKQPSWNTIDWAKGWIFVSAYLALAGWILSAFHHLDRIGYSIGLGIGVILLLCIIASNKNALLPAWSPHRLSPRFRHFFPAFFLFLLAAAFLGGALYPPNNYDALSYRLPRILHWVAEGRWHWILTGDPRKNFSGTGMEWLMTPLFIFTHSDRFFFLINIFSYAFLPGLIYGTFTQLGVSKRAAWYWMWLLPCGYCFVTQAGSAGNDAFPLVYFLASLHLAIRFQKTLHISDLWASMLAAALLTGVKTSNLPLLAPWAIAAFPALRMLKGKLLATLAIAVACIGASAVPLIVANVRYTGDWTGDPNNSERVKLSSPVYAFLGNGLQLITSHLAPPIMPAPQLWNAATDRFLQSPFGRKLVEHYPRVTLKWGEFQLEENGGIGLGLCVLLAATVAGAALSRKPGSDGQMASDKRLGILVAGGGMVAWLVYMVKLGSESCPRLLTPYYPVIILSILLLPGANSIVRKHWWKALAVVAALSALPSMILTPARPLWPAITLCQRALAHNPNNRLAQRALAVYSTYQTRNNALTSLRKYVPQDAQVIGFLGNDQSEVALWHPLGHHRVVDICPENMKSFSAENRLIFTNRVAIKRYFNQSLEEWLQQISGQVIAKEKITLKVSDGPDEWYVVKIQSDHSEKASPDAAR